MKIYIAGPMTGYKNFNRTTFRLIAEELEHRGYEAIHTADMPDGLDYEEYIEQSLELLAECDAMFLLPEWYMSNGVINYELPLAQALSIPATESLSMLEQFRSEMKRGKD